MQFAFHNNKRRKSGGKARRKHTPTAKQKANWARFAREAKARAKSNRNKSSKTKRRSVASSERKGTTMPKRRTSGKRSRGRSRAGSSARGFALNPLKDKSLLMDAAGIVGATVAVPLVVSKVLAKFVKKEDGTVDANKYMLAKLAAGLGLAFIASKVGQKRLARSMMIGTVANAGYDALIRAVPKLAPQPLGGMEDEYMASLIDTGHMLDDNGGMGQLIDTNAFAQAA